MTKTIFKTITFSIHDYSEDIDDGFIFIGSEIAPYLKQGYKFTHVDAQRNEVGCYLLLFVRLVKEVEEDE